MANMYQLWIGSCAYWFYCFLVPLTGLLMFW